MYHNGRTVLSLTLEDRRPGRCVFRREARTATILLPGHVHLVLIATDYRVSQCFSQHKESRMLASIDTIFGTDCGATRLRSLVHQVVDLANPLSFCRSRYDLRVLFYHSLQAH